MKNATNQSSLGNDQMEDLSEECEELLASLPKEKGWRTTYAYQYEGFWCPAKDIAAVVSVQKHFKANDTDLILTSLPKSGTTWMKFTTIFTLPLNAAPEVDLPILEKLGLKVQFKGLKPHL